MAERRRRTRRASGSQARRQATHRIRRRVPCSLGAPEPSVLDRCCLCKISLSVDRVVLDVLIERIVEKYGSKYEPGSRRVPGSSPGRALCICIESKASGGVSRPPPPSRVQGAWPSYSPGRAASRGCASTQSKWPAKRPINRRFLPVVMTTLCHTPRWFLDSPQSDSGIHALQLRSVLKPSWQLPESALRRGQSGPKRRGARGSFPARLRARETPAGSEPG